MAQGTQNFKNILFFWNLKYITYFLHAVMTFRNSIHTNYIQNCQELTQGEDNIFLATNPFKESPSITTSVASQQTISRESTLTTTMTSRNSVMPDHIPLQVVQFLD